MPAYHETNEGLFDYIKHQIVYVMIFKGEVVGDIIINNENPSYYDLEVVAIHPDYQGRGIGQKAMAFIEEDNHLKKTWVIHTPHKEIRNHYFYEKLGCKKVNESRISEKLVMFEFSKQITD